MKALWIRTGEAGLPLVADLPLPFRRITRPIDPEIFRRQARGENVGKPRLLPATGLQCRRTVGAHDDAGRVIDGRGLVFVISGEVRVSAGGGVHLFRGGDLYFQDDLGGRAHRAECEGDCRLLFLGVADSWMPEGETGGTGAAPAPADGRPLLRRMYKAVDDRSYFRDFAELFPEPGRWTPPRPAVGFHFVHFPPGFEIGWHPEGVNNFVVMLSGALELEVGGDGAIAVFGPGDVCLAEDRTGEGHIDRTHGETRMALIVFEDEHLWPMAS